MVPLESVAVATNCCWRPAATDGEAGVTAIETITAGPTFTVRVELADPTVAEMIALPVDPAVINPPVETVATAELELLHVAVEVTL